MQSKEEQMINSGSKTVQIDAKQFGGRFSTKVEVWKFLAHEVGAYLPDHTK